MTNLTKEDIETLEALISVEKEILNEYKKIIECDLKKESKYHVIRQIIELELQELMLINKFENTNKDLEIVKYLNKKYDPKHIPNELESYFNNTDDLLAVKRLISYFKIYADMCLETYKQVNSEFNENLPDKEQKIAYQKYIDTVQINQVVEKDNIFILLNNISELINNNIYNLREPLTKLKYHIIYMTPIVETRYIENDFVEQSHDYLEAKLQSEMTDLGLSELYDDLVKVKSFIQYQDKLEKLLKFSSQDFSNREKLLEIVAYLAYIKTLTVTLDRKIITTLIKELEEMMTPDNQDKLVILRSIKLILMKSTNEKNKHRLVSMIRTRN